MKYKNNDVFVFVSSFYLFSHKPDDETLYVFNFKSKQMVYSLYVSSKALSFDAVCGMKN